MHFRGRTWVFGRNVNTDLIFPKMWFRPTYEPGEMASHLMVGLDVLPRKVEDQTYKGFDVGPNYHGVDLPNYSSTAADEYLVATAQARGGESITESPCVPTAALTCQFPDFPGTVSWKIGFQVYRDAPVADTGAELSGAAEDACEALEIAGTGSCRHRFDEIRKEYFHYVLYAHARGVEKSTDPNSPEFHVPRGSSGIADMPGGDALVSLGLWENFVGSDFMQAPTRVTLPGSALSRARRNSMSCC